MSSFKTNIGIKKQIEYNDESLQKNFNLNYISKFVNVTNPVYDLTNSLNYTNCVNTTNKKILNVEDFMIKEQDTVKTQKSESDCNNKSYLKQNKKSKKSSGQATIRKMNKSTNGANYSIIKNVKAESRSSLNSSHKYLNVSNQNSHSTTYKKLNIKEIKNEIKSNIFLN